MAILPNWMSEAGGHWLWEATNRYVAKDLQYCIELGHSVHGRTIHISEMYGRVLV